MDSLHIALVRPEIHPNMGNIARLCAASQIPLHLVGRPGFRTDDRAVRRAGLDYWPFVDLRRAKDLSELKAQLSDSRFFYLGICSMPEENHEARILQRHPARSFF